METFKPMLLNKLYGTTKTGQIFNLFKRDVGKVKSYTDIITLTKKYMPFLYLGNSYNTINTRFTDLKNIIKAAKIGDKYKNKLVDAFSAPVDFYRIRDEIRQNQLLNKIENNEKKEIAFDLSKFDEIVKNLYSIGMDEELTNYPYKLGSRQTPEQVRAYFLAAYLALTTGRRFTEILKSMEMRRYKDNIKIKGILKKRNGNKNETHDLMVLDDIKRVLSAYRELRRIFDATQFTERQINQKFSYTFNQFLKTKILPNSDLTFHDLRKIYLLKAYEKYGNNEDFEMFAEKILLHDIKLGAKFITQTSHYTNATTATKED